MRATDDHSHKAPSNTPKRLIIVVALAFIVPITLGILLANFAASGRIYDKDSPAMSAEEIAKRIQPIADASLGPVTGAQPPAPAKVALVPAGRPDGKKVYEAACMTCHATGVAKAPKFGDKTEWAPHLAHGAAHLAEIAIKGKGAMPPKGGNAALSDAEVKAAVDYMLSAVK